MKVKKLIALSCACLMTVSAFAGCSDSSDKKDSSSKSGSDSSSAEQTYYNGEKRIQAGNGEMLR